VASPDSLLVFCPIKKQRYFRAYNQNFVQSNDLPVLYHYSLMRSLLFRQQDGVDNVVRIVHSAIHTKLAPTP